jgi:hypothetical protein
MKDWIIKHWFAITMIIGVSIIPIFIIGELIYYNCEEDSKVYVEWTVYDGYTPRNYSGTYEMKGSEFEVQNYWQSAGKYRGSYRVVRIVDKNAGGSYINRQSVCIYTGMNDVEVTKIKVLETK